MDKQPTPRRSNSREGRLFGELTMHRTCHKCGFGVPVNGPTERLPCDRCGELVDVASLIDGALLELRDDPYGERRSGRRYTVGRDGMMTVSGFVQLREESPVCGGCGALLPAVEPGRDETMICDGCGAAWETFPPPEAVRTRHPYFLQCYDAERSVEQHSGGPTQRQARRPGGAGRKGSRAPDGDSALLLACPNCGATVEAGEKDPREQACTFCQTRFLIPDAAWEHLHPVRRKRRWYVELTPSPEHPAQGPLPRHIREIAAAKPEPMSLERREFLNQRAWIQRHPEEGPAGIVFARFRIAVRCTECGSEIPVNGPVRAVTCGTCFARMKVGRFVGGWIRDFEYGSFSMPRPARRCRIGGRGINGEAHAEVVDEIACPACGEPLPQIAPGSTDGACVACGAAFSTFPGPAWLRDEVVAEVQCVLCDPEVAPVPGVPDGLASSEGSGPFSAELEGVVSGVAFDCLGCGASMPIGREAGRICRCPFCLRDQFLPDEFWFRLHPPQVTRDWFLIMRGPLIADRALAEQAASYQLSWNDAEDAVTTAKATPPPAMSDGAAATWRGHLLFALKLALAAAAGLLLLRWCS